MHYQFLVREQLDKVVILTINRPEVNNALNALLMKELRDALEGEKAAAESRVIVIRGAGNKAFCAGADLGEMMQESGSFIQLREHLSAYAELICSLIDVGKPTIAAVHGYALAGGCGLAVACDLTIASERAQFGVPEINIGLWGMMISALIFRAVGMKKGLEMFYTGNRIDAYEAERIGLVNKVVPSERLLDETMALAHELASKSPVAMKLGRQAYYTSRDMDFFTSIKYLREMAAAVACTEDCREGIAAFKEKRSPIWKGR